VRRFIGLAAVISSFCLAACGPGGSHSDISESKASTSALSAIVELDRYHAQATATVPVTGYTVVGARLTTETASVPYGIGNVLTVSSAPSKAWVVEITAPPQGIWGSISAVAEVDSTSGVVVASNLVAVPANAPVKGG
jgi:hypothetical protein